MEKNTILIADDSNLNREILTDILGDRYNFVYAENGVELIEFLNGDEDADLIILDINMPQMDGFEVLRIMNNRRWIEEIPVIVISAENDSRFVQKAYELGATDYITRPFHTSAVQHKTENTLMLYSRQKRLVQLVEDQVYEREKINNAMINILSHVIETRNSESGTHILNLRTITAMLLHHLVKITDRYPLTENNISLISTLSALHDIGKITIPKKILNKPGKLTDEEWEVMKSHTVRGDELLQAAPIAGNEQLMLVAHSICRWHHERWDGNGYPDGLRGDDIPISAQAVSIADVYDALTSERCYKMAYSHEEAINMILNGECGTFNPILLQCLTDIGDKLKNNLSSSPSVYEYETEAHRLAGEMLSNKSLPLDDRSRRLLSNERTKRCGGIQFEYDKLLGKITYIDRYTEGLPEPKVFYLADGDNINLLNKHDWNELKERLNKTTPANPEIVMTVNIPVNGKYRWHRLTARTVWPQLGGEYISALGQFTDIHDEITEKGIESLMPGGEVTAAAIELLKRIFGTVRLVNPHNSAVFEITPDGKLIETPQCCYELWGRSNCCENCSSLRALKQKNWIGKLEISGGKIYSVLSKYIKIKDRDCVLEIAFCMDEDSDSRTNLPASERTNLLLLNFYRDALTNAYSRMYLEDFMPNLENSDGVAVIDADNFKQINDTYGHQIGDIALKYIAETIHGCITENDTLIRYGGDEFLLIFSKISETEFYKKLKYIEEKIQDSVLKDCGGLHLTVSIGGAYRVRPLQESIAHADKEMYANKTKGGNT